MRLAPSLTFAVVKNQSPDHLSLYVRYPISLWNVENFSYERIDISQEAVRICQNSCQQNSDTPHSYSVSR